MVDAFTQDQRDRVVEIADWVESGAVTIDLGKVLGAGFKSSHLVLHNTTNDDVRLTFGASGCGCLRVKSTELTIVAGDVADLELRTLLNQNGEKAGARLPVRLESKGHRVDLTMGVDWLSVSDIEIVTASPMLRLDINEDEWDFDFAIARHDGPKIEDLRIVVSNATCSPLTSNPSERLLHCSDDSRFAGSDKAFFRASGRTDHQSAHGSISIDVYKVAGIAQTPLADHKIPFVRVQPLRVVPSRVVAQNKGARLATIILEKNRFSKEDRFEIRGPRSDESGESALCDCFVLNQITSRLYEIIAAKDVVPTGTYTVAEFGTHRKLAEFELVE